MQLWFCLLLPPREGFLDATYPLSGTLGLTPLHPARSCTLAWGGSRSGPGCTFNTSSWQHHPSPRLADQCAFSRQPSRGQPLAHPSRSPVPWAGEEEMPGLTDSPRLGRAHQPSSPWNTHTHTPLPQAVDQNIVKIV